MKSIRSALSLTILLVLWFAHSRGTAQTLPPPSTVTVTADPSTGALKAPANFITGNSLVTTSALELSLADYLTTAAAASTYLTQSAAASSYQPLDSDLTAIAAISTQSFGRSLLTAFGANETRIKIRSFLGSITGSTGSMTLDDEVNGRFVEISGSGNYVVTLPTSTADLPKRYLVVKRDAGGSVTTSPATGTLTAQGDAMLVWAFSSSTWRWVYLPRAITSEGGNSITTLGTIATGTWQATPIADSYISSAATWNAKEPAITAGTTAQYWRGDKSWQTLNAAAVGLGNVANVDTTNASNLTSGTVAANRGGAGTVTGVLKADGSGNVSAATAADLVAAHGVTAPTQLTASGNTSLTLTTGDLVRTFTVDVGVGAGGYTHALYLPSTNATAGAMAIVKIALPASNNPRIELRDLTSGGTLIGDAVGNGIQRVVTFRCVFDGTNWFVVGRDPTVERFDFSRSSAPASATWDADNNRWSFTLPVGLRAVTFDVIGAGAGGGSGRKGAVGTVRGGGGGGGPGRRSISRFVAADLPSAEILIRLPAGGLGGASVTANSTSGNSGTTPSHDSSVTTAAGAIYCLSGRGFAGGGGTTSGGAGGTGEIGTYAGNNGLVGAGSSAATNQGFAAMSPNGGAGGGSIDSTNTLRGAGFGAAFGRVMGSNNWPPSGSSSGSGGAASTTGNASAGGSSSYGGGGGGGGGATDDVGDSGAGGNGGDAWASIEVQY